ncbi:hypothetical protein RvY_18200-3 [Ramazzottius varieornatus]|uniref:Uncharacterized protein n=1 Tax=Ramazzottius varieornatus TaxID=947166 RepID=A0A1D1WA24_RAMVA|nr:hypothetical protein RvY_18200-3 [Ramazzottius varieornatus]
MEFNFAVSQAPGSSTRFRKRNHGTAPEDSRSSTGRMGYHQIYDKTIGQINTVTDKLSADKEATIHRVHFYINGLVRHLECIRDALSKLDFSSFHLDNPFDQVILAMESELSRVLGYVINERDPKFDAVHIASTFLHKKLRLTLPHRVASLASRWLALKSSDWYEQNIPDILPEPADPNVTSKFTTDDDLDFFVAASLEVAPHNSHCNPENGNFFVVAFLATGCGVG